jgi:hypothetical protein
VVKSLHPLGAISPQLTLPPEIRIELVRAPEPRPHAKNGAQQSRENGGPWVAASYPTDAAAAVVQALQAPLNYPALALGVVPSDHVAIAVDETVPQAASVVSGVVRALELANVERSSVSVVASDADFLHTLRTELSVESASGLQFVVHDPDDEADLCLVARTDKDMQLYLNRTLFEADVVLPIGCARLQNAAGTLSVYESLFPRFSSAATIARFRTPSQHETAARESAARRRCDEAGWLLGVPLVIQVVPGEAGRVADVVAGEPTAVAARCERLCRQLWSYRAPQRASLVIASITGGRQEQTWDNVARALSSVDTLVEEGGAVAICSDLSQLPGQSLGRLAGSDDWEAIERETRSDHSSDSRPAWQLARALQRGPVYFLSQLADEIVEELGLAPVNDLAELERLAGHHESCIVLDDSQYAVATVAADLP